MQFIAADCVDRGDQSIARETIYNFGFNCQTIEQRIRPEMDENGRRESRRPVRCPSVKRLLWSIWTQKISDQTFNDLSIDE